jgi:DNA-binding beta-propeller fold protein YncE
VIEGQATKLGRTIHGIAYDPAHDEIVVPNPQAAAVLVFRGQASGAEPPIRIIQGPKTQLVYPHSVNVDIKNKEIIVADPGGRSVLVFPWDANGNVAPTRVIQGPKTNIGYMVGVAIDPVSNLIFVGSGSYQHVGILIFNRTDNGDVAPRGAIAGPDTGIIGVPWQIQVYPEKGLIFVGAANIVYRRLYQLDKPLAGPGKGLAPGGISASPWRSSDKGFLGVWKVSDNGNIAPRALIRGPVSGLVYPSGIALNPKCGEVIASDSVRNGLFTFLVPDFFKEKE